MNHVARALIGWIALFAICQTAMVVAWAFSSPTGTPLDIAGGLIAGAFTTWLGVQFARASTKRWRERAAVGRADEIGRPRDGEFVVARGILHTTTPLLTPFSRRPAVAYAYKAWRRERRGPGRNTQEVVYWWGEGSAPCSLLTRQGTLEVRSRLWLEMWSAQVENTPAAQAAFDTFMRGTQPDVMTAGVLHTGFDWNAPLDGLLRRDRTREDPPPLSELTLTEWVVAPDEQVVLMGRYSDARGGLVHDDARGRPLRVLKGDVREVRAQLRTGALTYGLLSLLAFAATFLLAGTGLGWHEIRF